MKSFRSTWIMAGLVACLAAYTLYEFKTSDDGSDEAKGERPAFKMKREEVQELNLKLKGLDVVIKKTGDSWQMEKPVQDLADPSSVDGFLFGLQSEKLKTFRSDQEDGKIDWAAFGLDAPASHLELVTKNARQAIDVSSKNAFDGSFFVRQDDQIFLGDRGLAQLIERSPQSFRSRKLWRNEGARIERVDMVGEKTKFSLVKDKDTWVIVPKPQYEVAPQKVAEFVSDLEDLTAVEVIKDDISDQDQVDHLLRKPSQKIAVKFKDKDDHEGQWLLTLGQDKGSEVFLFNDQRSTLYKTAKSAADRLRVSSAYFRDGKVPFAFDIERAATVTVHTPALSYMFKKGDGGWELAEAASEKGKFELDQDKLIQLIQNLHALEASDFVLGASVGIKAAPQVEVKDSEGKTLFSLSWGDEFKGKNPWSSGSTMRYTKTNLSKEIMGVAKDKVDKLIDAGLVRQKPVEKKAEAPEKK